MSGATYEVALMPWGGGYTVLEVSPEGWKRPVAYGLPTLEEALRAASVSLGGLALTLRLEVAR